MRQHHRMSVIQYFYDRNFDFENTKFEMDSKGNPVRMYEVGKYYKIETPDGIKHFKYLGVFYNLNEVPLENCLYCIDNNLYVRNIDYDKLLKNNLYNNDPHRRNNSIKIDKNDSLLNTTPSPNDNILLLMLKLVMKHRNLTESGFKKMFTDTSEMNNMKRLIFHGNGNFSWAKFVSCLDKLNADVIIQIVDKENREEIVSNNQEIDYTESNNLKENKE